LEALGSEQRRGREEEMGELDWTEWGW
jgi:hypothetical protein